MIEKADLREIINQNKHISSEIKELVKHDLRVLYDENLTVVQKISMELDKKSIVIKMPINAPSLGGFVYKSSHKCFCYINTNQARSFQNFVVLHEYYHLAYDKAFTENKKENNINMITFNEENSIEINERKANYYASLMLLDESSLQLSYSKLKNNGLSFSEIICYLIDLYKVPKKTILIRLYEIGCIDFDFLFDNFETDIENIRRIFDKLGLDKSCLEPSQVSSGYNIEKMVKNAADESLLLEDFIKENLKNYNKILKNLKEESL